MQALIKPAPTSLKDRICEERAKEIPHRQQLASIAIRTLFPSLSSVGSKNKAKEEQKENNG